MYDTSLQYNEPYIKRLFNQCEKYWVVQTTSFHVNADTSVLRTAKQKLTKQPLLLTRNELSDHNSGKINEMKFSHKECYDALLY